MKRKKIFVRLLGILTLFVCGFTFSKVRATEDTKHLIRQLYRARLEYRSDSCASQKMSDLIRELEKEGAADWSETLDWVVAMRCESIVGKGCLRERTSKLCSEVVCKECVNVTFPVVADFGKSPVGNHWMLIADGNKMLLERVEP